MENKSDKIVAWIRLATEEIFNSRWLRLRRDTCQLPSSRIIDDYYVIEAPDGVVTIAITSKNELILVRQYKHGLSQVVLELPAGIVEPKEEPSVTIARELREETGYVASNIEYVITLASKPARMSARTHIYYASNVELSAQKDNNDSEIIETVLIPIEKLPALIQRGDIITDTSLAALLMVWNRLMNLVN